MPLQSALVYQTVLSVHGFNVLYEISLAYKQRGYHVLSFHPIPLMLYYFTHLQLVLQSALVYQTVLSVHGFNVLYEISLAYKQRDITSYHFSPIPLMLYYFTHLQLILQSVLVYQTVLSVHGFNVLYEISLAYKQRGYHVLSFQPHPLNVVLFLPTFNLFFNQC